MYGTVPSYTVPLDVTLLKDFLAEYGSTLMGRNIALEMWRKTIFSKT
jgi:hypothetical protein